MGKKLDKFFGISAAGSNVRTEIIAGIVTFLAMAYILVVNPNQIAGSDAALHESVFVATALGAIVGTLLMAFLAKLPLAQAPGMGLNSMVGGLIGGWGAFQCTFGNAMLMVFISGVLFLLLSIITVKGISIRELVFDGMPASVRGAISVGIGLFIAFIGMQNAGFIVKNEYTLVALAPFATWDMAQVGPALVCLIGLLIIAVLDQLKVKGSVIIGIVVAAAVGIPLGVTTWSGASWAFWERFANYFSFDPSNGGAFLAAFTGGLEWSSFPVMGFIMTIITFCMIDMFDTMGTVVGCCVPVGLADENGKPFNYDKIMVSDSVATCTGALFGTSTVTTFVESGSGIGAGGRTGMTALVVALLFFVSIFLYPLISSIPSAACASALIYVGSLMLKGIKNLKIDSAKEAVPAFLTIAMMPLAYSITTGIGFGVLSYVVIDLIEYIVSSIKYAASSKKEEMEKPVWDLSVVTIVVALLFIVYFFVPTVV